MTLAAPLRAAGITVIAVGDARAPQEMLFATASGHAAGEDGLRQGSTSHCCRHAVAQGTCGC